MSTRDDTTRVERLEREIESLPADEFSKLRDWFDEHDWDRWEEKLDADIAHGRLDHLADEALREHAAGRTRSL